MARKPEPKSEIDIFAVDSLIFISTSSEKARRWINEKAPKFGKLVFVDNGYRDYHLSVNACYDAIEVGDYLRDMPKRMPFALLKKLLLQRRAKQRDN